MSFAFGSPSTNTILAATDSGYVLVADTRTKRYIIFFFLCVCLLGDRKSLTSESIDQFSQFDKNTVHGNDVMVVQFVVLFLARAIFRETSTEMDVKTVK